MKKFFIVVTCTQILKDPRQKNSWQNKEKIECRKNLKPRDYSEAIVILDVANQKVIKNFEREISFEELFAYYIREYPDYINRWLLGNMEK